MKSSFKLLQVIITAALATGSVWAGDAGTAAPAAAKAEDKTAEAKVWTANTRSASPAKHSATLPAQAPC